MEPTPKNEPLQGDSLAALLSLEEALLNDAIKDRQVSFVLKDGRHIESHVVRRALKAREKRGDEMVDCIDEIRLDNADAPAGAPSVWVRFSDIAAWKLV